MVTRKDRGSTGARKHVALAALAVMALLLAAAPGAVMARQAAGVYAAADLLPEGTTEGVPASGPYGTATFERTADGATRVTVVMMRLEPNSTHVNHVHDGSCTGAILLPLEPLQAGADGMARAVTELAQEVEFGRWYVNVHAGAALPSPGIACGRVNPAMGGAVPPPGGGVVPPAGVPPSGEGTSGGTSGGTSPLPGMPVTGGQSGAEIALLVLAGVGAALTAAGLRLRGRRARAG